MWWRKSRGSKDILRFGQDPRPDERREGLRRDEVHSTAESSFQEVEKCKKAIECLGPREELNEEIKIAVRSGFAAKNRTEQREPLDAECLNLGSARNEGSHRLVASKGARCHGVNCTAIPPLGQPVAHAPPNRPLLSASSRRGSR